METFISANAYSEKYKSFSKTGWGCGYVHIPKDHPILIETLVDDEWGNYLSPKECPEEITWSAWANDKEWFIIGFDTAHSYNNASHDEEYVIARANEIKTFVDAYTAEDANQYALNQINLVKLKFNKYLL